MLKIVPDPPHYLHSLEDTLIMAADYALCAEVVAQQAMLMQPNRPLPEIYMSTSKTRYEAGSQSATPFVSACKDIQA